MIRPSNILALGMTVLVCAAGASANNQDERLLPVPQLHGVWITQVTIRDCQTGAALLGPFPGLATFHSGGTISEIGPALPNTSRSASQGTWRRTGASTFETSLVFERFDVTGLFLGTQVIHGKPQVARGSDSFKASGTFEVKDSAGSTIASGCSSSVGTRFE